MPKTSSWSKSQKYAQDTKRVKNGGIKSGRKLAPAKLGKRLVT